MRARILIEDAETHEILEELGNLTYSNTGLALQNCEQWYAEDLQRWADKNYQPQIVLIDEKQE